MKLTGGEHGQAHLFEHEVRRGARQHGSGRPMVRPSREAARKETQALRCRRTSAKRPFQSVITSQSVLTSSVTSAIL